MSDELGLFGRADKPDHETAWKLYEKGLDFNRQIKLEDTVRVNENFFIGK